MEEWKQRLRVAREEKGMSKTAFAAAVGVSNATATDWEKSVDSGGIKEISGPKLTRASEVLGIDPHWLLHGKAGRTAHHIAPQDVVVTQSGNTVSDAMTSDAILMVIADMVETYRLAGPADRERIDLVFREIRDRLATVDQAKPRAR
jgi:transcriptional regulator with XRE-family HTH domain